MDQRFFRMKVEWLAGNKVFEKIDAEQEVVMLKAALEVRPDNHTILKHLVSHLSYQNKHDEANEITEKFIEANPDDHYALLIYSNLLRKQKNWPKAFAAFHKMLELDYRTDELLGPLAFCYLKTGDRQKSLEYLEKALALPDPNYQTVRFALETMLELGMNGKLMEYFEEQQQNQLVGSLSQSLYLRAKARTSSKETLQKEVNYAQYIKEIDFNEVYGRSRMAQMRLDLMDFAMNHPRLQYDPSYISTTKGYQAHIGDASDPMVQALMNRFKQQVNLYLKESYGQQVLIRNKKVRLKPWIVILNKGGYQKPHVHPAGVVSGVFYLQIPEHIAKSQFPSEGWIEFGISPEEQGNDPKYAVKPEEGKLLLFPSYLAHRTIPLEKDCSRICFAFDVVPE